MSQPSSPSSSQPGSQSPWSGGPIYLYAFIFIAVLVVLFVFCSTWRGVVIRRRRRELGLPEFTDEPGQSPSQVALARPPIMYSVRLDHDPLEKSVWQDTMPVSFAITDKPIRPPELDGETDPNFGVSYLTLLSELVPTQAIKRKFGRKDTSVNSPPPPRDLKALASVFITMPTQERHRVPNRNSLAGPDLEAGYMPEIQFGVYEAPWTVTNDTLPSSST
ncbi:hypothetical protein FRB99_003688 [Tulasnella sp. 403]|nr:hypothetical protein FRB99_003688 [Tulasnella sp. 403]